VTAHVTKEGNLQEEDFGDVRQRLDLETEQVTRGSETFDVHSGLRVSVYNQQPKPESGQETSLATVRLFHYGERLRFPAKLSAPRNFRNPGAFDYRAYLKEKGIAALASTKLASVEVLPGFSGSRVELWRSRIHRSILQKFMPCGRHAKPA
jgi:predicted membrane metal-binding protein